MKPEKDHSRVTPEGKEIGRKMAQLTEKAVQYLESQGEPDERCDTCAFRLGTVPNGCPQTQMDALKCVIEGVPFMCHHKKPQNRTPCFGWYAGRVATRGLPDVELPWEFSPDDKITIPETPDPQ